MVAHDDDVLVDDMTMTMIRFLQGLTLPERKLDDDNFADAQAAAAAAAGPLLTSRSAFAQSPRREDAFWSPGNWGGMQEGLSTLLPMQADLFKHQAMSPDSSLGFGGFGGGGGWFEDLGARLGGVGKASSPPQQDEKGKGSPPFRPPAPASGEGQEGAITSRKQARRASGGIFSMFGSAETPRAGGGGGGGGDVLAGIGAGFAGLGHGVFSVFGGAGGSEHERPAAGNSRQQIGGAGGGSSSEAVRSRPPSARDIGRGNVSARSGVSRQNVARYSARGSAAGAEEGRRQSSSARRKQ
jgi:hypothetical protein